MDKELEERIKNIEKNKDNVKKMSKKDYIGAALFGGLCLLIIIIGAYL